MRTLARWLYAAAANLTTAAAGVLPPGNSKTSIALRARRGIDRRYARFGVESRGGGPLLWMHAPSVGEGLQARPVLALMRARRPATKLAYTFFSPSAEEFSRSLDVDFRDYLPFDSSAAMQSSLDALKPTALVFSKVDVWPELVRQAKARRVPLGMISATLAAGSSRRGGLASLVLRDAYAAIDAVGAIDEADADRLIELGVRPDAISVTGDTRFDQVWQRAQNVDRSSPLLSRLAGDRPTLVAGSTWPSDELHMLAGFQAVRRQVANARIIIAPHEATDEHLQLIEKWAAQAELKLARVDNAAAAEADVVLVDRFGILGDLYALATVAFVGGGFHDAGLHSVLEPAAYGAPVLFGPRNDRSRDAGLLIQSGGAKVVTGEQAMADALGAWFLDTASGRSAGASARALVERNRGAAERSLQLVERLLG
ncbi:MAG TPA: glycosyltransferase N-terminal domain-containing protein [Gemmatimonadaceae bacterium]